VTEAADMSEPVLGLAVALALAAYLVVTLLRPERF
jgi:K+-transporting ATPase KdpF subunit